MELLSEGALTLTTVGLLAPHLTAQNQEELLRSSRFRSKRQVEEIVASSSPTASAPTILRKLPAPRPESGSPLRSDNEGVPMTLGSQEEERAATPAAQLARNNARAAMVISLGAERYKVQFTASKETYETLRHVRNLMRHQIPDGDLDQIIQRALTALLNDLAKQKVAATEHPSQRRRPTAMNSRHIPAEVRRKVWLRDGGQCTFVGRKGRRCPEVGFLEFHHVRPYADGGGATEENIQLRCRAHNAYEAELWFGPRFSQAVTGPESFNSVRTEFG